MGVEVRVVTTKKETKQFMEFANILYQDEPNYIPPIFSDEMKSADPKYNLNLKYCDAILLLAYKEGKIVGRLRGVVNHKYNDKNNLKHLRFNHFDVIDDFEVTKALFNRLIEWGKEKGMEEINGPIGFNDLDKQGLLIEGFDLEGMFITYYNFPYHMKHLEKLGFVKDVDWVEYRVKVPTEINPRITKISNRLLEKSGFKIQEIPTKKQLKPYLYKIFDIYNEAFAPLHGVVELTKGQIDQYVNQYLPIINLDFLSIIVDKEDNVVAFGLLGPSLNEAMRKIKGRLFPFGFITLLRSLKRTKVLDMYLVAVKPDVQGLGLNSILMNDITNNAIKNHITYAETGPELEDNDKITSFWKNYNADLVRRRRCFIRKI
ncbi:MAG: hypothetical protein JXB08_02140 [Bacilli bacterium]|nr:hypothetical protein [Bacilli bacterium]MBN2876162.1 hypothetical protein [Bacilli bacterium]